MGARQGGDVAEAGFAFFFPASGSTGAIISSSRAFTSERSNLGWHTSSATHFRVERK